MANTTTRTLKAEFDGDTSGLAAAAAEGEAVIKAFGKNSGDGFANGFGDGIDESEIFGKAAKEGISTFGETLTNGIKNLKGPLLVAAGVGIIAVMPLIGSLAAGGLVLAFGAGLAGLGIAAAAKSPAVVAEFTKLKDRAGEKLKQISAPFEESLISIAGIADRTLGVFWDPLEESFEKIAPAITGFADNLGTAFEGLAPTVGPISDAFVAILDALGPEMPGIVSGIAEGITAIAESIAADPDTFVSLVVFLFDVVEYALKAIAVLNSIADDTMPVLIDVLGQTLGPLVLLIGLFKDAKEAWDAIKGLFGRTHTAKINGDDGGWSGVLSRAYGRAKDWAASTFTSGLSAAAGGLWTALDTGYHAGRSWASARFSSTLSALNKVGEVLADAEELGRRWAGRVFNATFGAIGKGIGSLVGRAEGGQVNAGGTYLVGERGPEVVTFGENGNVTPNHELGGGDTVVYVTIDGQQLQGRIDRTVRENNRGTKRAVGAGALRGAPA